MSSTVAYRVDEIPDTVITTTRRIGDQLLTRFHHVLALQGSTVMCADLTAPTAGGASPELDDHSTDRP